MDNGRVVRLLLASVLLAGCDTISSDHPSKGSRPSPPTIVRVESLSDGIIASTVQDSTRPDLVALEAAQGDMTLPGSGRLLWERKDEQGWEPAFDGPFSSNEQVPEPVQNYASNEFETANAQIVQRVLLSTPHDAGVYRACTIFGECVSIEVG